jgi:hypothetical protein
MKGLRIRPALTAWSLGVAVLLPACRPAPPPADPAMVAEWMHNYYGLIRAERISPPVASRLLAYAAVALHEGLAAATPTMRSLAGQLNDLDSLPRVEPDGRYDPTLVALAAERTVLDTLFQQGLPSTKAALAALGDSLTGARLALGIPEEVGRRSAELGRRIGLAILVWSHGDGFDATRTRPFTPPVGPGLWVNDSRADEYVPQNLSAATDLVQLNNPNVALRPGAAGERTIVANRPKEGTVTELKAINPTGVTEPYWGTIRPFVLRSPEECPMPAHAPFSTDPGSAFYAEADSVYQASKALDDEQRLIALYWADNPGQTGTPTGHWLSIGSQLVSQLGLTIEQAAELFVLSTVAQADAFIAAFHMKYRDNLIRPNTYIRRHIDPEWKPAIVTPTFPEYPSAHSVQSMAAATVMTRLLGPVAFDDSTNLALGHPVRRFPTFVAAAEEAAQSRIYGGIHYPMGRDAGKVQGACIGEKVLERLRTRSDSAP